MAKQITWSEKARRELFDILEFWNTHNHSNTYSLNLYQKIQINLKYISENSFIGRPTNIAGVRVVIVSNYLIFYQISTEFIEIVSVFDGRRNPSSLKLR